MNAINFFFRERYRSTKDLATKGVTRTKRPKNRSVAPMGNAYLWQLPGYASASPKENIHNKHLTKNNKIHQHQQIDFQRLKYHQNKTAVYKQQFLYKSAV